MSVFMVPEPDPEPFPTLGGDVCDWIEDNLTYGPGVLKGDPYVVEPWVRGLIYRAYEVFPADHPLAARRRFKLVSWSLKKGSSKTEIGAILTIVEAHPEAPARCDGFDANGDPVGIGVAQPFIPMFAFSLDQSEELGYSVVREIISESSPEVQRSFDVGMERVLVLDRQGKASGKILAVGHTPAARDGARTTFALIDETHHLVMPRHKKAVNISRQNLFKRAGIYGSGWQLETTTAYSPGEQSVAEDTHDYAKRVAAGTAEDPSLFYFHRQADDDAPLETKDDIRAALIDAAGPTASWSSDIDGLVNHWFEPNVDRSWFRRVWLNQPVAGSGKAFDAGAWLALGGHSDVPDGEFITLGFDGARRRDATALIGTVVDTGYQFVVGIWQRPDDADEYWEMPSGEVDAAIEMAFDKYLVAALYCDPPYWSDKVDEWAGKYGDKIVVAWWTNRPRALAYALRNFAEAIVNGTVTNDGDSVFASHVGNAFRQELTIRDDEDRPLWGVRKERSNSPNKIDAAVAAVLSWEARGDIIAKGSVRPKKRSRKLVSF